MRRLGMGNRTIPWFSQSYPTQVLTLAALCVAAYACCLNNGLISDDYENLRLAEALKSDFWYLFKSPPFNFRMTSFLAYALLDQVFAQHYEFFYAANILLHLINCLLLWKLLLVLGRPTGEAYLASILFAVFQAPQEGVMWIAAMNETLLGSFVLSTLVLWFSGQYFVGAIVLLLALFSKESASIVLLLIPLIRGYRGEKVFTRHMIPLFVPTLIFIAVFVWSWPANGMIQLGVYQLAPHGIVVAGRTLHLLFRPSFYVVLGLLAATRQWQSLRSLPKFLLWIVVPMLPYSFLTYSPYIPSRQLYMSSMVLVSVMAYLICQCEPPRIQLALVIAFLAYNISYMWIRNDPEFESRAAPTTQLLALLTSHQPAPILLEGFPYPNDIAKNVSRFAPGWTRDLIHVNEPPGSCRSCVTLRWDAGSKKYSGLWEAYFTAPAPRDTLSPQG